MENTVVGFIDFSLLFVHVFFFNFYFFCPIEITGGKVFHCIRSGYAYSCPSIISVKGK